MGNQLQKNATGSRKSTDKDQFQKVKKKTVQPKFGLDQSHALLKLLGKGGTGETWLCRDLSTQELVAAKFIQRPLPKYIAPMVLHEIQIQSTLGGHINIVAAREVILTPTHLALIIDYAPGGSLTNYVQDRYDTVSKRNGLFLTEDESRYFIKQCLGAVEYMHQHHVAHRDIKLDNTLLDDQRPPTVKICDFGFAKEWGDIEESMNTQIGTPVYMAPELISTKANRKGYDGKKVDVWAIGVLLFVMLLGMFPFDHIEHQDPNTTDAQAEVWNQQIKSDWKLLPRVQEVISKLTPECLDLLDKIFTVEEAQRFTIFQIKEHPWFSMPMSPPLQKAYQKIEEVQENIAKEFDRQQLLKMDGLDNMLTRMLQLAIKKPMLEEQNLHIDLRKFKRNLITDTRKNLTQLQNFQKTIQQTTQGPSVPQTPNNNPLPMVRENTQQ